MIVLIGGDRRMAYMARALVSRGYEADRIDSHSGLEKVRGADVVVFPVPLASREGKLSGGRTAISARVAAQAVRENTLVMAGRMEEDMARIAKAHRWRLILPTLDPAFGAANAMPSAEGAVYAAMARAPFTIRGSHAGIIGYGSLGKELAKTLLGLGAAVSIAARREESRLEAQAMGCAAYPMEELPQLAAQSQILFNTVPCQVAGERTLRALPTEALAVELASPPYGIDLELAREMGVQVLVEPGIPGRYAPKTAGELLAGYLISKMGESP